MESLYLEDELQSNGGIERKDRFESWWSAAQQNAGKLRRTADHFQRFREPQPIENAMRTPGSPWSSPSLQSTPLPGASSIVPLLVPHESMSAAKPPSTPQPKPTPKLRALSCQNLVRGIEENLAALVHKHEFKGCEYSEDDDSKALFQNSGEQIDSLALDERLAQLDEEAKVVEQQLSKLKLTSEPKGEYRDAGDQAVSLPVAKARGNDPLAAAINQTLRPVLHEYGRLVTKLEAGAHMSMVLHRGLSAASDHQCCAAAVRVNIASKELEWEVDGVHFAVALSQIAAIFCGGSHEGEWMGRDIGTIFRLHIIEGEPLQFATSTRQDRQDWVVGLALVQAL